MTSIQAGSVSPRSARPSASRKNPQPPALPSGARKVDTPAATPPAGGLFGGDLGRVDAHVTVRLLVAPSANVVDVGVGGLAQHAPRLPSAQSRPVTRPRAMHWRLRCVRVSI